MRDQPFAAVRIAEQNRVLAWRLKLQREASVTPRNVAQTCGLRIRETKPVIAARR